MPDPVYPFHSLVVVKVSPERGRGVFAARDLAAGQEIEVSPVLPISLEETRAIRPLVFSNNLYDWLEQPDGEWTLGLVTGMGMLFNHSYRPNCDYDRDYARQAIVYRTLVPIAAGEEIFVNYNGYPEGEEPVWFDVV
jgi:SET domain-containing protein